MAGRAGERRGGGEQGLRGWRNPKSRAGRSEGCGLWGATKGWAGALGCRKSAQVGASCTMVRHSSVVLKAVGSC